MLLIRKFVVLFAVLFLVGCETEIHGNLTENDANEALAVLLSNGIHASKTPTENNTFRVMVDEAQFAGAVQILSANGLPRKKFAQFNDVFQSEGLIASPIQEWAKYNFTITQELSSTISSMPGVISASIHLANTKSERSFEKRKPPSASVHIRLIDGKQEEILIPQIKRLVSFGVEGVSYEKVSVLVNVMPKIAYNSEFVSFFGNVMQKSSAKWFRILMLITLTTIIALMIVSLFLFRKSKKGSL